MMRMMVRMVKTMRVMIVKMLTVAKWTPNPPPTLRPEGLAHANCATEIHALANMPLYTYAWT